MKTSVFINKMYIAAPAPGSEGTQHTYELLNTMLTMCRKRATIDWVDADASSADVVIFPDNASRHDLSRFTNASIFVATLEEQEHKPKDENLRYFLRKPLRVMQVVNLLEELGEQVKKLHKTGKTASPQKPIQLKVSNNDSPRPSAESTDGHWQLLLDIRQLQNKAPAQYQIEIEGAGRVWVDTEKQRYLASQEVFSAMASEKLSNRIQARRVDKLPAGEYKALFDLVWRTATALTRNSRDACPWIDLKLTYKLTRWPDLGLLRANTQIVKLISCLSQSPLSVFEASEKLGLQAEEAMQIFNALAANNLLKASGSSKLKPVDSPESGRKLTKFIGALRRHFSL